MDTQSSAMDEIMEIEKSARFNESLQRLSQNEDFAALDKLLLESITVLKDVTAIKENEAVEVRARQLAVMVLEGLLDSIKGAGQNVEFYTDQLNKLTKGRKRNPKKSK